MRNDLSIRNPLTDKVSSTFTAMPTYSYDNNGNLTGFGTTTYAWDYRDRITQSSNGHATSTYGYDQNNQRVWQKTSSSATTTYPNMYYSSLAGASTTAYIYLPPTAGGDLVAYIETGTTTSDTFYVHPDNLGSTNVVTDKNGNESQIQDYYPYGSSRIASSTPATAISKRYVGQYFDSVSSLNYLNARYESPLNGQFLSEDPVFLGNPTGQNLQDPQSLNAYSYSEGNPIIKEDPLGRDAYGDFFYNNFVPNVFKNSLNQYALNLSNSTPAANFAINHPYLTSGALSVGLASVGVPALEASETFGLAYAAASQGAGLPFVAENLAIGGMYSLAAAGNAYTLPEYFNSISHANSSRGYINVAGETALRAIPATGNLLGTSASFLLSNIGTGAASLTALYEDLSYANGVLTSLLAAGHRSQTGQASGGATTGGSPSSTGIGVTISNGQTPINNSNGTTSYCLWVCLH